MGKKNYNKNLIKIPIYDDKDRIVTMMYLDIEGNLIDKKIIIKKPNTISSSDSKSKEIIKYQKNKKSTRLSNVNTSDYPVDEKVHGKIISVKISKFQEFIDYRKIENKKLQKKLEKEKLEDELLQRKMKELESKMKNGKNKKVKIPKSEIIDSQMRDAKGKIFTIKVK